MAIDDNVSYELTGYQVKDLAQKIRAKADSASLASVATSGLYSDLTGAPTIPTVYNGTLTIQQNGTTLGTFSANQSTDTTVNLTGGGATYSDFTGATSSSAGTHGLVPAPAAGDQEKVLTGDGTWKNATAKLVEMSYGESNAWAKFIAAYNAGSIVYCRASSNSNPATGSQTRKAFMAYVNNAANPTEVEFQYVRSMSSKTDSQQCDQVFVYKLTNASGGTWTVTTRNMSSKVDVSGPITKTFVTGANATVTIGVRTMTGATSSAAGTAGVVPAPAAGDNTKFLSGDGTWKAVSSGGGATVHKLAIEANDRYAWDPVICPVSNATQGVYVYDPDVGGPLDAIQLVQWAMNGDEFAITGASGMSNYGKVTPIKAIVDVIGNYDFDPTDPQVSQISSLQIRFHVADVGSWGNPTNPGVPFEYDVILFCSDLSRSNLEWEATVYQGDTLPLYYEALLEEGAPFTWETLANSYFVQGVNTPSTYVQDALTHNASSLTSSAILQRILSALFAGRTISIKALVNANDGYFAFAGIEFDRFLLESTEGYFNFSDAYNAYDAIINERAKLYLYASSGNQGLTVQIFGENITVSGS